jgi:hypothetical protein
VASASASAPALSFFSLPSERAAQYIAKHRIRFMIGGGILGACGAVGGGYLYLTSRPGKAEAVVTTLAVNSFGNAASYELKKVGYGAVVVAM